MAGALSVSIRDQVIPSKQCSSQFSAVLLRICQILDRNCIEKLEDCKHYCSTLTVDDRSNALLYDDDKLKKIDACKSFLDLSRQLRSHLYWSEYSILVTIIDICESKEAEEELELYRKFMALKMALTIVSENVPSDKLPSGITELYLVVDKPYKKLTMQEYMKFRNYIFQTLNVESYIAYPYIRFFFSSLHLKWYVPIQATNTIKAMAKKNEKDLIKNGIIYLEINTNVMIKVTKSQVSKFNKLCFL